MGKALTSFADFVMTTNQNNVLARSESGILAEVQSQQYLQGRLAKGKPASKILKGGRKISTFSQFTAGTQSAYYQPGDTFTTNIEDLNSQLDFYFRFMHDSWAYTKHEVEFNMGGPDSAGINPQIIDLLKSKRQGQMVGMFNTVESAWWTSPSAATMETAATANRPYSIRCFITEDGLHPSGFTALAGVPSSQTRYRNKTSFYTAGAIETGLKPAFAAMLRKIQFARVPSMTKYFEDTNLQKFMILTDNYGATTYQLLTENSNDRLAGDSKDLGVYAGDLPYAGIPVSYITAIDDIGFASNASRYYWINSDYLHPVWHQSAYFTEMDPMTAVNQPHVYTVHVDLWYQLICPSRQRLGIVCPG